MPAMMSFFTCLKSELAAPLIKKKFYLKNTSSDFITAIQD
jgi:hypothetical protein